uniref:Uncharacterized protein n=1 Tax=Arundo donax TaxID=35708 RepID=A0A0A9HZQ6_ARUDO
MMRSTSGGVMGSM